jgi:hypothetical protein
VLALDAANTKSYPGSGTSWSDISGYSNTISNLGSVGPSFGNTGSIAYFDYSANIAGSARASYAYTDTGFSLNNILATSSFSIEMWISRNTASLALGDRESLFGNTNGATGFRFQLTSNALGYLVGGSGSAGYSEGGVGGNYLTFDGRWYQVAMVFDRQAQLGSYTVYAYANGVNQGSVSISSAVTSSFIGGVNNSGISSTCCSSYKGRVAKLSVYNKAFSSSEVLQNYNALKSRFNLN